MANRSDNFNRADSPTLGTPSDAGSAWVRGQAQGYGVSANQAVAFGSGPKTEYLECGSADADIQCTLAARANNPGILFRYADALNYWFVYTISNYIHICKVQAGTLSDPAFPGWNNDGVATADGDVWKVTADVANVEVFRNGTSVLAKTDASGFNRTATKHGLYADAGGAPQWDDFGITPRVTVSFAADRASVLVGASNTVAVSLTGTNTTWDGATTFGVSGVAGWSVSAHSVADATHATVTLTRSTTTGTLTISDGTNSTTLAATDTATTTAAGSAGTAANWDTLERPTQPHKAIINHALTADATWTLGTSPSDTTTVVLTVNDAGSLTVSPGVTFTVRGNASVGNTALQVGTTGGGAVLEFDASAATTTTTQYQCVIGGNAKTSAKLAALGTGWEIRSNAGGGNAQVSLTDGQYDLRGSGAVTRMGTSSTDAFSLGLTTPAALAHTFSGVVFDAASGRLNVSNSMPAGVGLSLVNCTFKSPGGNLHMSGSDATPTATREIRGCVFLGTVAIACNNMTLGGASASDTVLFLGGVPSDVAFTGRATSLTNCFFRQITAVGQMWRMGDWSECAIVCDGNTYDGAGRYSTKAQLANVHWTTVSNGPAGTYAMADGIIESFGMDSDAFLTDDADGDFDYGPDATHTSAFSRLIMVPQDRDSSPVPTGPACIATNMAGTGSTYDGCTHYNGSQGFIALNESIEPGTAGQVTSVKNSIIWNDASASGVGAYNGVAYIDNPDYNANPTHFADDIVSSGAADYNNQFHLNPAVNSAGAPGYKYQRSSGATVPGAHDLFLDPQFKDITVRFWRWVKGLIGSNVIPAPASGGSTLTVTDDAKMGGPTAGNPSPPATGWKDYCAWGLYKLSLKNEPGHADYDSRYTLAAYKAYIRNGFTPTNAALKGTGYSGADFGAVPVQAGNTDYAVGFQDSTGLTDYVASF